MIVNSSAFHSFILHLQLFNYIIEGFIAYSGYDSRLKEELQICFSSMPSHKLCTIRSSDFLDLVNVLFLSLFLQGSV